MADRAVTLKNLLGEPSDRILLPDVEILGVTTDSRKVRPGWAFLALPGLNTPADHYLADACNRGAVLALMDVNDMAAHDPTILSLRMPVVPVPGLKARLGDIFSRWYHTASLSVPVIGITGTNGKTSVAFFIASLLQVIKGKPQGIIGTVGTGLLDALEPASHTTPDVETTHRLLASLRDAGAGSVAMEVSSHALTQRRIDGVPLTGAVFTNLTQDHLDYHGDMVAYGQAKRKILDVPGLRWVVINADDPAASDWYAAAAGLDIFTVGLMRNDADLRASNLNYLPDGVHGELEFDREVVPFHLPLCGQFNVYNMLSATGALLSMGIQLEEVVSALPGIRSAPGRMQVVASDSDCPVGLVDYAHTPDALRNVLLAIRSHFTGRLICVFGCGGDRDRGKRPQMGAVASELADVLIVTSDNPRTEDPLKIIDEIMGGVRAQCTAIVQPDRKKAIRHAVALAGKSDVILVAGKGHETYQDTGLERVAFDDVAELRLAIKQRKNAEVIND